MNKWYTSVKRKFDRGGIVNFLPLLDKTTETGKHQGHQQVNKSAERDASRS